MLESQQEIEATLTEMESCMRLLFPDFSPIDIQTANSSPSNSQPATKCPSDDEQPCCSKDLRADGRGAKVQEREENTGGMGTTEENRKTWKEKREREKAKKGCEGIEGKDGEKQEMHKSKEAERREVMEVELEEESEQEESSTEEEEADDEDFIRNSGLISHSYSLDLNLSPGA